MPEEVILTILMPCLNEARTLPGCIRKAQSFLSRAGVPGEILVADNGSSDSSREIAEALGARVVAVNERGYGSALRAGVRSARGKYVIMGDSDESYDFLALDGFLRRLEEGHDLVIGNRFSVRISPGAMPFLHRYLGNPVLTLLGRMFFGSPVGDINCGLRGFRRDAMLALGLNAAGMEFAIEMIVKSAMNGLSITEVPTTLSPDGRDRPPHLRTFRDGWRSLRFYLLMSPRWLFLYPGALLALFGAAASAILLFTDISMGGIVFSHHSLILTAAMTNIGVQSVFFWAFAAIIAAHAGLLPLDPWFGRLQGIFSLEGTIAIGASLVLCGLAAAAYALLYWYDLSFGEIAAGDLIRAVCAASFLTVLGFQVIFAAFFICLLDQVPDQLRANSESARLFAVAAAE